MDSRNRPLSPHLQVYRPQLTSAMSIAHRVTGVALAVGTILLTCWLAAAAAGPESFDRIQHLIGSFFGYILLFGWTAALFYHLCNGLRHLAWDMGWGFELPEVYKSGYAALGAAGGLTVLAWVVGLIVQ